LQILFSFYWFSQNIFLKVRNNPMINLADDAMTIKLDYELPEYTPEGGGEGAAGNKTNDLSQLDSMFEEVARFVVQNQQGSTSSIQRRFSIGYNRAGRIMDQLEMAGVVGKAEGSKPREVLIADMMSLEKILSSLEDL